MAAAGYAATFPIFERIREERVNLLDETAAYGRGPATIGAGSNARPLSSLIVSDQYFSLLGVRPLAGRFFNDVESSKGSSIPVAVISHRFMRDQYGTTSAALGQTLRMGEAQFTIIGIAPVSFVGVDLGDPDLWLPMGVAGQPGIGGGYGPGIGWLQLIGRLRPGLDLTSTRKILAVENPRRDDLVVGAVTPEMLQGIPALLPISLFPLRSIFFEDTGGQNPVPIWVLGLSAAVLLIACATVSNVLLALGVIRRRELAIRLALGSSTGRLVAVLALEGLLLAGTSTVGAAALAWSSVAFLDGLPIPPLGDLFHKRTLLLGLGVTMTTPLIFGLLPALSLARQDVHRTLRTGVGTVSAVNTQRRFLTVQIAMTFVLLFLTGLFYQSLVNAKSIPLGWDIDRLLAIYVPLPQVFADPNRSFAVGQAVEGIRRLPGVEAATLGGLIPFRSGSGWGVAIEDGRPRSEQPQRELGNLVDSEFFRTMGIPLRAGRLFDTSLDRPGTPLVAIVSASFAQLHWPTSSPLGACLTFASGPGRAADTCASVVGVVGDARFDDLLADSSPLVYLSRDQIPNPSARIFARVARSNPATMLQPIRETIQSADPNMPFPRIEPMSEQRDRLLFEVNVAFRILGGLALLATILAIIGVYEVVACIAAQRIRELAIRSAVGATRTQIIRVIVRDSMKVAVIGGAFGSFVAFFASRFLATNLYGVSSADMAYYVLVIVIGLVILATLATLPSAFRASTKRPNAVLQEI